jgi:hypothetical protein
MLPNGFEITDHDGSKYTIVKFEKDYYQCFRVEKIENHPYPNYITKFFSESYVEGLLHEK